MKSEPTQADFRQHLPNLASPRFKSMQQHDAHTYADEFKSKGNPPWLHALYQHWLQLLEEPFQGVTNDGIVRRDLFRLQDEGVNIDIIVTLVHAFIGRLDVRQRQRTLYHIDSPEWRTWSNPEYLLSDKGVRLDEIPPELAKDVLEILQASLSPEGYEKAISAMRINGFLGQLVHAEQICNEKSYNFAIFGRPSVDSPWGYSLYGHHLCLNVVFVGTQMVISPWFTGAEPNTIDVGPYAGTKILHREDVLGLRLMQSLPAQQQDKAQVYKQLHDEKMPLGRWNHDDQRHLCGAYRDNRVVPYEGIMVSSMNSDQVSLVTQILEEFLLYLPSRSRQLQITRIEKHYDETYFCWIGGFSNTDSFYFRIQSPVIIVEFDHHSGVFLSNKKPARFHIHTMLRTPNGGDYGKALLPLLRGEQQAFVWKEDEEMTEEANTNGQQRG